MELRKCRVLNVSKGTLRTTQTPIPQARDINHLQLKTPDPTGNRTRGRRVIGGRVAVSLAFTSYRTFSEQNVLHLDPSTICSN